MTPIRPENRKRYPPDWAEISLQTRMAAGWKCQGSPLFPHCRAENGKPHPDTGSIVVLTVAHLDQTPEHCAPDNLRAMCQRCHLNHDREQHAQNRIRDRYEAANTVDMFNG